MNSYLLDTSALLALRDDEPGAERVAALLVAAARNELDCFGCFISQMELFVRQHYLQSIKYRAQLPNLSW